MGVYYSAHLAYGVRVPESIMEPGPSWEWLESNTPIGYTFIEGGDFMTSHGESSAVICKKNHVLSVMDTSSHKDEFGVHKVDKVFQTTPQDKIDLIKLAQEFGVPEEETGYFVVTSVG